jgi:ABC-type multidrug transport system fused ATPase/permease subunit
MVTAPLISIASIGTQITEAFAGLDRIRELRDMATEDQEDANKQAVPAVVGHVAFEHVSFEYEAGVPVLRDVSFDAPAGTTTALVGSSGSGKSTMISLIMAFAQPQQGRIRVDGTPVSDLKLRDYRQPPGRGHAGQLPVRRHGEGEHRLHQARGHRRRDHAVAKIANAHDFISQLPRRATTRSWANVA